MNAAVQPGPRPTITGAFFALFQAIYVLFTDLLGAVFQLVTPWNAFILVVLAFCLYLVKLFWDFLCNQRNVRLTKSYVRAACAAREMWRACGEMHWWSVFCNTVFSVVMLLIFLTNALFFIFWISYCFIGSLVCPLETYTEEQVAVQLPALSPPTVTAPVSFVSSFQDAMGRIRGIPPATAEGARVQRRTRGAASSGTSFGGGAGNVMRMIRRRPTEITEDEEIEEEMNPSDMQAEFQAVFRQCWQSYQEIQSEKADAGITDGNMDPAETRARPAALLKGRRPFSVQRRVTGVVPTIGKHKTGSNGGGGVTVGKKLKGNSDVDTRGSNDEIMEDGADAHARDSGDENMDGDEAAGSDGEGGMAD